MKGELVAKDVNSQWKVQLADSEIWVKENLLQVCNDSSNSEQDFDDMIMMNEMNEGSFLQNLRQRYTFDKIYVSLNPLSTGSAFHLSLKKIATPFSKFTFSERKRNPITTFSVFSRKQARSHKAFCFSKHTNIFFFSSNNQITKTILLRHTLDRF